MTEREETEFSWSTMFLVTGVSGFVFSLALKLLDGQHSPLLLWIGGIATGLWLTQFLINFIARTISGKKTSQ
ncbi:MAG: hypothetical protein J0M10_13510 [Chitinophagales bacterium]|nr:hypothetical protein [Chitinophagales bacterium]